jgi:flagellar M-ring protein FliF
VNYAALLERWNQLTLQVKILIGAGLGVLIVAIFASFFFLRDNRVPLFAKALTAEQVTEVDGELSAWQIPFNTTTDNVIVDRAQRSDLLLRLSMVGIPHETMLGSADALAKVGAMTPQSVLDIQTRDALSGDISMGLRGVDGIADARVIIAPAKQAFFADDESRDASASVRVIMQTGRTLNAQAIQGIRRFVANSVSGLSLDHVAVIDERGMTLGEGDLANSAGNIEKDIQSTVQSALDNTIGTGITMVRVHAEINKTSKQEYAYRNAPMNGAPISKIYTDERLAGKDRAYSKVHGNESHGSQGVATRSVIAPGGVERLSVAVMVDDSLTEQIPQIRELVAAAAGINSARGDVLTVAPLVFHHMVAPILTHQQSVQILARLLPGMVIGLTIVGILLVLMQPIMLYLRRNANREILSQTRSIESGVDAGAIWRTIHGEPAHVAAAVISQLPTSTAVAVLDMYPEQERREITERLSRPIAPVLVDIVKVPSHA